MRPLPTGPLPIIVGGQGPSRTPRLAGTYADEFNTGIRTADEMKLRIERARAAAEKAGRDPANLKISTMTAVIAGADQTDFEEVLGRMADADPFGRDRAELETRYRERGLPTGTADEVQSRLEELASIGFDRIYVQHFGPYDTDLLEEIFSAMRD